MRLCNVTNDLSSEVNDERPPQTPSQGLSISLSSSNPSSITLQSFDLRPQQQGYYGKSTHHQNLPQSQMMMMMMMNSLHQNNSSNHHQFQIGSSKYLSAAQELLSEFCSLGVKESDEEVMMKHKRKQSKQQEEWDTSNDNNNQQDQSVTTSKNHVPPLHSLEFMELQKRKAKLVAMLEELKRRYGDYREQMRLTTAAFEAAVGVGAAETYTALASRAMSRHFRCLKNGLVGQIQATSQALGERDDDNRGASVAGRGGTPRLRLLDQALTQQNSYPQMNLVEAHPWRPQPGLPERAVTTLRAWLFEHFLHPYPSDFDKHILARQSGLSRSQVSNWFINARVRLWKPMIEEMYCEETRGEVEITNPMFMDTKPNPNQLMPMVETAENTTIVQSLSESNTSRCFPGRQEIAGSDLSGLSDTSDVFDVSSSTYYYDVVIRYRRGENDFISHLHAALSRKGISVQQDFDEVDAVPRCRVLIICLPNADFSCGLLNILEHACQVVYPIFYGISPSDLITNSNASDGFFHEDEANRWQAALEQITQIPGYILTDKSESELIDVIVRDALKVLRSNDKEEMIGMDIKIKEILSLLCIESPDFRSIGIWGTVGVGKTAIAEDIFHRISFQYETCVFLKEFHEEVKVKGHNAVREEFLSKLLEVEPDVICTLNIKTSFLKSRLQRKRALVILDDVNDFSDVETFVEILSYFGPSSRIIITSRNRHVFVLCKVTHVYEVKPLDFSNSLLLLGRGTFQSGLSHELCKALPLELVKFSYGNPQVLQFISRSSREWKSLSHEIQKTSAIYIPGIFERSCCGLDDNEKNLFLDIACFFKRMDKDDVAMLLDGCGFSAHIGFRSLVDKSLLTISHNMVDMLSFLQATGREIVRQESVDRPGDRSRLWNAEDIRDILIENTGTSAIEGIFLDTSQLQLDANPNIFEKMWNLRLLKFYCSEVRKSHGVSLPQGLEYLPSKLRLLHWENYPLSSLPPSFDPKNLVELNLPNSCVKKLWKGKKSLEKLKKMRLGYSYQLTKIPRLASAPNLELLDLEGCKSLVNITHSICHLKKLVFLNLKNCSNLKSVPSTVDLEFLEVLNLSGCSKLENFPEISPNVRVLYMSGTMLQEIPSSIKNLVLLQKLDLENSRHLVNLPTSICKLKHLETLNLSGCSSLEHFPDLSRKMKCLKSLDLSRTAIKELPASISYLTALEELRVVGCKSLVRLPDSAWSLRFKVEFRQIDTEKFSKLWNRFGWLKKVQIS